MGVLDLQSCKMNSIIEFNRKTLSEVKQWIKREDWEIPPTLFNYGLPPYVFHLIDKPISNDLTEADLICELFRENTNYLEIGVSVGKTFYQIIKYAKANIKDWTISCIDIEKINPILRELLNKEFGQLTITEYESNSAYDSIRKDPSIYVYEWNQIKYYESDEFDLDLWIHMNKQYNLIFSDALHEPHALIQEYTQLKEHNLLDKNGFVYCFDDLDADEEYGKMWKAVKFIYNDICKFYRNLTVTLHHSIVNGWLGQHEGSHHFGIIKCVK